MPEWHIPSTGDDKRNGFYAFKYSGDFSVVGMEWEKQLEEVDGDMSSSVYRDYI